MTTSCVMPTSFKIQSNNSRYLQWDGSVIRQIADSSQATTFAIGEGGTLLATLDRFTISVENDDRTFHWLARDKEYPIHIQLGVGPSCPDSSGSLLHASTERYNGFGRCNDYASLLIDEAFTPCEGYYNTPLVRRSIDAWTFTDAMYPVAVTATTSSAETPTPTTTSYTAVSSTYAMPTFNIQIANGSAAELYVYFSPDVDFNPLRIISTQTDAMKFTTDSKGRLTFMNQGRLYTVYAYFPQADSSNLSFLFAEMVYLLLEREECTYSSSVNLHAQVLQVVQAVSTLPLLMHPSTGLLIVMVSHMFCQMMKHRRTAMSHILML